MSINEVIKAFDVNSITADNINLYLSFTIDRKKAASKGAKYIKVCIDAIENIGPIGKSGDDAFMDDLSFNFKSKSSPSGLNLYRFEDNLLDLSISDEEVTPFKEYPIAIRKNKAQTILAPASFLAEKPHAFKVYILNKNKSVLEKYSWQSPYNLDEYTVSEEGEEFLFSSLESSLDLVFTPYNIYYNLGPYLKVDTQLLENPALNFENITLEVFYRENKYTFEKSQTANVSSNTIRQDINPELLLQFAPQINSATSENYSQSIFARSAVSEIMLRTSNDFILDVYENFIVNSLLTDEISYKIIYGEEEIIKQKQIDKSTIESLYFSYYNKNKDVIVSRLFSRKINIQTLEGLAGSKIQFKQYNKNLLPAAENQSKIRICRIINGQEIPVENLYTSTSFDEDLKITTYNNQGFLLESLYERPDISSQFYIKKTHGLLNEAFRIYLDNTNLFQVNISYPETTELASVDTFPSIDYDRPLDLNFQINKSFKNPRLVNASTAIFDFDMSLTSNIIETAARYDYEIRDNENLESQIVNNTILLCEITNRQGNLDCLIPIRLKNVLQNNIFTLGLPFNAQINSFVQIKLKTLVLPYEMCDKIISNSGSDDDKEKIAEYLNLVAPSKYTEIDRVVRGLFFNSSQELTVISSIFNIVSEFTTNVSFLVGENLDLQELLENVRQFDELIGI